MYYDTALLFTLCFCGEGFVVTSYVYAKFPDLLPEVFYHILLMAFGLGTFVKQVVNIE